MMHMVRRFARRLQRLSAGALTFGIVARPAAAQEAVTRLGDLYTQVAQHNPRLYAAQSLVRAAQARIPGAKRPPDPQLQFGLMNYSLPGLKRMEPLGMTQLQLMQMIPLGGKLALAGRVAGAQADATGARADEIGWELRKQTAMAFYDLYATDRQLSVARETLRLLQDISHTAESMYRVGEGRQVDVLRANVELARMAEDTLRMRAMRASMTARLNALMARATDAEIGSVSIPVFPDSLPSQAWLDSAASTGRPMIRAGQHDVRAAESSAGLARKEIIPDLQVGVQYGRGTSTMIDGNAIASRGENMGSLMIGASIPIFARDRQYQMRNEANAMRAMAEAELSAMRAETRGKIGEAYAELVRARNLGKLYRGTVLPQAEATVSSALSSYRVGKVDFMTLLDDQMTVNKYRQELIGLVSDEGKAWAELEMLTGRQLLDPNSTTVAMGQGAVKEGGQ